MRTSLAGALSALAAALVFATSANSAPRVELVGKYDWRSGQAGFGGLSGLELSDDGSQLDAVSDDGVYYSGVLTRNAKGVITAVDLTDVVPMVIETGKRPETKALRDFEGLAHHPEKGMYVSVEGKHRVLYYSTPRARPQQISAPADMANMPANRGFEALAIDASGRLVVMPEWSGALTRAFPVFRRNAKGRWQHIANLPRHSDFRPVGADFGPDGHLYVLSRAFSGFAFAIRIDRILFDAGRPTASQALYVSRFGQFDNLEGLAVWTTPQGDIRLTAVSDDNFSIWQRTWLVDFALRE